jgi:glycosyltransferase involved in cell wall biosynthesis
MLVDAGHEVFFYGSEGSDVAEYCNSDRLHFIQTHTLDDIRKDYGDGDNRFELGYNWTTQDFRHDFNADPKLSTLKFYKSCIDYINANKKPDDFLLCTQGNYHKPIADMVQLFLTCESGIGYRGSCASMYRSFESPYIQNFTYGSEHPLQSINGSYYDRVIPNYFDENDITFKEKKQDYYLFIGRVIRRKGIMTAYLATKALGKKLIIAGQGAYIDERGYLVDNDPREFEIPPDSDWEYIGYADVDKRKELMANAIATFTPTEYLECFAGTHVESMLSGTPPITTDFGVFPYTIPNLVNGKVGFRCNTLQDFVDAAREAVHADPLVIRNYANRFLMQNVVNDYLKWFTDLHNVWESAIDNSKKGWSRVE